MHAYFLEEERAMSDETQTLATIELILGRFNDAGRAAVLEAIDENPTGCVALAQRIAGRKNVGNPPGLYLSCIAGGEHLEAKKPGRHTSPDPISGPTDHRDWARRLYTTKLADLFRHHTGWTADEQRQHAIDYALDHCKASGSELWQIERELKAKHGVHLTGTERDFERDTDHRRLMIATHSRQAELDTIPGEPEPIEVTP